MCRRCEARRYRDVEGLCNNLDNPHWGAAMVAHSRSLSHCTVCNSVSTNYISVMILSRFLPQAFADGISAPRISVLGTELPSARLVSVSEL